MTEPVPILTVGDLKSELSRWSDDTPVTFYSPLKEQEFRFHRYRLDANMLVLEINEFPGSATLSVTGRCRFGAVMGTFFHVRSPTYWLIQLTSRKR
jgi:hypothetical protein